MPKIKWTDLPLLCPITFLKDRPNARSPPKTCINRSYAVHRSQTPPRAIGIRILDHLRSAAKVNIRKLFCLADRLQELKSFEPSRRPLEEHCWRNVESLAQFLDVGFVGATFLV